MRCPRRATVRTVSARVPMDVAAATPLRKRVLRTRMMLAVIQAVGAPKLTDGGATIPAQLACRPGEPVVAVALSIGMFCGSRVHGMLAGRERQRGKEVARAIFGIILANKCTQVLRLLPVCRVRLVRLMKRLGPLFIPGNSYSPSSCLDPGGQSAACLASSRACGGDAVARLSRRALSSPAST